MTRSPALSPSRTSRSVPLSYSISSLQSVTLPSLSRPGSGRSNADVRTGRGFAGMVAADGRWFTDQAMAHVSHSRPVSIYRAAVLSERTLSADIHQSWASYIAFGCASRNLIASAPFCVSSVMTRVPPRSGTSTQA
jgi:hypothetical protein